MQHISVGQIETFRACPRAWWFRVEQALRPPEKPYLRFGKVVAAVGERYRGGEELYPAGWDQGLAPEAADQIQSLVDKAARAGYWQIDPRGLTEHPICFLVGPLEGGLPVVCRPEVFVKENGEREIMAPKIREDGSPVPPDAPHLVGWTDLYIPAQGGEVAQVWDDKTAKNRRYGKTKSDIRSSWQLPVYACLPLAQQPATDLVRVGYNVLVKDPEATTPVYRVEDLLTRPEVVLVWAQILELAERITKLRIMQVAEQDWSIVQQGSDAACESYGGCPYRPVCLGQCSVTQLRARFNAKPVPVPPCYPLNLKGHSHGS